jgi:zinc/manganese transport system permease protein
MIVLSIVFGVAADYAGLLASYYHNLPSGPAIVLMGGIIYGVSLIAAGGARLKALPTWGVS